MQFGGSQNGVLQQQDEQLEVEEGGGGIYTPSQNIAVSLHLNRSLRCGHTGVSGLVTPESPVWLHRSLR